MAESELHRKGSEIRRKLLGDKYVERVNATTYKDPVMKHVHRRGHRERLRRAVDAARARSQDAHARVRGVRRGDRPRARARIHLRMALRQGWTETELIETLIHMSGYVGVPIIREAMIAAGQVFAEVKAEG